MTTKKNTQPASNDKAMEGELLLKQTPEKKEKREQELTEIDAVFGDGTPYSPERMVNEINFYIEQARISIMEIGRRLILLKEHEPNGEFLNTLEQIDFNERTAQKYMQVVYKLSGDKSKLAELGKSKALELLVLDDETLDELAEGGTIAGKTLDDIDRMSILELRQTVRDEKQKGKDDRESLEKLVEEKNKKIDEQTQHINKLENLTSNWDAKVKQFNQELNSIFTEFTELNFKMDSMQKIWRETHQDMETYDNNSVELMSDEYVKTVETLFLLFWQTVMDTDVIFNSCIVQLFLKTLVDSGNFNITAKGDWRIGPSL